MLNAKAIKKAKRNYKKLLVLGIMLFIGFSVGIWLVIQHHKDHKAPITMTSSPVSIPGLQEGPCLNNIGAICISSPSINFYPADNEYPATTLNPSFAYTTATTGLQRQIGGKITKISGNTIEIKTTDKKDYSVTFPIDAVSNFNNTVAQKYSPSPSFKVAIGSTLYVTYFDPTDLYTNEGSVTISPRQLEYSSAITQPVDHKIHPAESPELLQ